MHNLVVLSDLHLWQATDHDQLWMRYRHRRFLPDLQLAALLGLLSKQIPDGELELVLNGDIFDFDIPPVVDGEAVAAPAPRRESAAVERMSLILDDHPLFLRALAQLLSRRHRIIFIAGNHDLQINFPAVQDLLRQRLQLVWLAIPPTANKGTTTPTAERLAAQLRFCPWFYRSAQGIHVEHGNQYDPYCSVSDPLWPFDIDYQLQTNVGTLALEHLVGKLGYFNPNVESSFLLTTGEYLEHWARYYLGKPRSLVGTWMLGTVRMAIELALRNGLRGTQPRTSTLQSPIEQQHSQLFARCDLQTALRVLLGVGALPSVGERVDRSARAVAAIHGAKAVIFGHTHLPFGQWEDGIFYGNSGTWVPRYHDVECSIPVEESRPFIWLHSDAKQQLGGGLYRFHGGRLHPAPPPPVRPPQPPIVTSPPPLPVGRPDPRTQLRS